MIYNVVLFLARLAVYFNFRKVYAEGLGRVPKGRHVIYGQNHPTAFLDPVILTTQIRGKVWTMLRGDKFVNAPIRYLLHGIHNLPIWRASEGGGREALRQNRATMDFATTKVTEGEGTLILSEGLCRHERRLRPIQRGTARMLFQAWRKDPSKDVAIVPVGTNYTDANAFRSSVTLTFCDPIRAADYAEAYAADRRGTVDAVTAELHRRLRAVVIHVDDPARDGLVDRLLPLIQHERPDPGIYPRAERSPFTAAQWRATEAVNAMDDFEAGRLGRDLEAYYAELARHDLTDEGVALPDYGSLGRAVLLWLLGPLSMAGWLLNFPIAAITQRRAEALVSNPQFFASVRLGLGLGLYLVYCLTWTLIMAVFLGWLAVLTPVAFATLGYLHLVHRDAFELWRKSARVKGVDPGTLARLRADRRDVLARVGVLREEALPADA